MRVLLDSHALVWFLDGDPRFSKRVRAAIDDDNAVVCVSSVTAWEISNKVRLGKWPEAAQLCTAFAAMMTRYAFDPLPVTIEHALAAGFLKGDHRDPFDRMLAAQATVEGIPLVTADPAFRAFGTQTLW